MAALVVGGGEEKQTDDDYVTAQLERLLAEAGLESVPIDPTSLDALKGLVADGTIGPSNDEMENDEEEEDFQVVDNNNNNNNKTIPSTTMMDSSCASLPMMAPRARDSLRVMEEVSAKEFVAVEGASPVENQILEQLHLQTKLLVDMQRRIDDLTATVNHLTANGVAATTTTTYAPVPNKYAALRTPHPSAGRIPPPLPPNLAQGRVPPTAPRAAPVTPIVRPQAAAAPRGAPPPPAQPAVAAAARPQQQPPQGMFHAITNSSILKIFVLFVKLRRRHVQELDGGLLFKILFMMAILSARMSSSSKKYGSSANSMEWHVKFACLVFLVLMGFLVQTGYVKYAHVFFVKENYPQRIWDGETVEEILQHPHGRRQAQENEQQDGHQNNPNAPLQPQGNNGAHIPRGPPNPNQPPQRNNNDNNNNAPNEQQGGGGWRNTFLGGMIPDANPGGVVGVLQDVGLLLGSFLMSIFPMWHPEAPRRPPPPVEPEPPQGGGMAAPGQVAPPRDVLQPADDDDDDGVDL